MGKFCQYSAPCETQRNFVISYHLTFYEFEIFFQVGSQGYNNVKAMHQRYQQDQEKYANDVVAFSNEIGTLEGRVKTQEVELTETRKKLSDVTEKYSDLKRRARQYKTHCQAKQVWSISSCKVTCQLATNDLNQVSSVSLLITSSAGLANEGFF